MKRKTSSLPSRGYKYDLHYRGPETGGEIVRAEMERAHAYFNTCIEINFRFQEVFRARRETVVESIGSPLLKLMAERDALRAEKTEIQTAIDARRQTERKRSKRTPEEDAQLSAIAKKL